MVRPRLPCAEGMSDAARGRQWPRGPATRGLPAARRAVPRWKDGPGCAAHFRPQEGSIRIVNAAHAAGRRTQHRVQSSIAAGAAAGMGAPSAEARGHSQAFSGVAVTVGGERVQPVCRAHDSALVGHFRLSRPSVPPSWARRCPLCGQRVGWFYLESRSWAGHARNECRWSRHFVRVR